MLPDYPKLKARIAECYRQRLQKTISAHLGVFSEVPTTVMQEGGRSVLHRGDGSTDTMEPKRIEADATLAVDLRQVEDLDAGRVLAMLDELAAGLAREKMKQFVGKIDAAVESVGNVVDTPGVEGIFAGLEKVHLDFDDQGNPVQMTLLFGSEETRERVMRLHEEIWRTPDLRRRYDALMARKREEWRDREAARNLVE